MHVRENADDDGASFMSTVPLFKAPCGFSSSALQALERMAATRPSAATVYQILSRLILPAPRFQSVTVPVTLQPGPASSDLSVIESGSFHEWAVLTDAYARQCLLMQRGDPQARVEALRLSREMLRMKEEMTCSA